LARAIRKNVGFGSLGGNGLITLKKLTISNGILNVSTHPPLFILEVGGQ
jgi:hypothetical protein